MSKTKAFPFNQNLKCVKHGICVATCVICHEQYVGQTKNKFSEFHGNVNKRPTHEAYTQWRIYAKRLPWQVWTYAPSNNFRHRDNFYAR